MTIDNVKVHSMRQRIHSFIRSWNGGTINILNGSEFDNNEMHEAIIYMSDHACTAPNCGVLNISNTTVKRMNPAHFYDLSYTYYSKFVFAKN